MPAGSPIQTPPIPVRVAAATDDWIVVDKPGHVLIHPTKPGGPPTLWDALRDAYPGEAISLVNRLDRETSGLVIASRHRDAASGLGKLIQERKIGKTYLTLVHGRPSDAWTVDQPLDRIGKHRPNDIYLKQGVIPEGYPALTRFETLETRHHPRSGEISLLRCQPESGRLHQIRVHLAHSGHPVVGDKLYGPNDRCYLEFIETGWTPSLEERLLLNRHALHASGLSFSWKGEPVEVSIPLAADLQTFWDSLEHAEAV